MGNTPQAFGSSGGKFHLAEKITALIPEHKTYVEPYAGGAAVYFFKEPAQKEVLNDADRDIAFSYRFIRDMTPQQYEALKKKRWVITRATYDRLKYSKPTNEVDRFYRFYYIKKGSFRHNLSSVNVGAIGDRISIDRLPRIQQRLRGVSINSEDALRMINKYDSPNTFFYLDPPYPGTAGFADYVADYTQGDLKKLTERLKHIRGKFILSMDTTNATIFPRWMNIKRVATKSHHSDGSGFTTRFEILASNFPLTMRSKPRVEIAPVRTNGLTAPTGAPRRRGIPQGVFTDKAGTRLSRRYHRGWKRARVC